VRVRPCDQETAKGDQIPVKTAQTIVAPRKCEVDSVPAPPLGGVCLGAAGTITSGHIKRQPKKTALFTTFERGLARILLESDGPFDITQ
jgi:hypothetical protein